jgi:hypothetical protein
MAAIDHAEEAIERLPTCLRGTNVEDLVRALCTGYQSVENALDAMPEATSVDGSEGAQLDGLGKITGELRRSESDASYRPRIRARRAVNRSGGRTEDLYTVARVLVADKPDATLHLREEYPAALTMKISGAEITVDSVIARMLREAKAAGVRVILSASSASLANTFRFDASTHSGTGFDGGVWADGEE